MKVGAAENRQRPLPALRPGTVQHLTAVTVVDEIELEKVVPVHGDVPVRPHPHSVIRRPVRAGRQLFHPQGITRNSVPVHGYFILIMLTATDAAPEVFSLPSGLRRVSV